MFYVKKTQSYLWILLIFLLAIIILLTIYMIEHISTKPPLVMGAKSSSLTAPKTNSSPKNNSLSSGSVVDKKGTYNNTLPPTSEWTTSSSGIITLQVPSNNSHFASGSIISGLAKVNMIQYILKDNSIGLISRGTLNVVNGKFSGAINFSSNSSSAKLVVYYPDPNNGAENDIINIDVKLN